MNVVTMMMMMMMMASVVHTTTDYQLPSFDYAQLTNEAPRLLATLQHDGILALRNIPQYATVRTSYLQAAAECAVQHQSAAFVQHRTLQDGTKRYTISTNAGHQQRTLDATDAKCLKLRQLHHELSQLIEKAVISVGQALDSNTSFQLHANDLKNTTTRLSGRQLMQEATQLDHFHAYQAPPTRQLEQDHALSLALHTDNGLMIAMTCPEYFDVHKNNKLTPRQTRQDDAGLVIVTSDGKTVQPVLQAHELVLMMGSGINQWIKTTPRLHPVLHGMKYPNEFKDQKVIRAWFGKMLLLANNRVMANTGTSYGVYADQTSRYLLNEQVDTGFAAVACPPHRSLQASDKSCVVKTCTAKPTADLSALNSGSCQVTCNHFGPDDEQLCQDHCVCETTTAPGTKCWMLCVANLSTDKCAGAQQCSDAATLETLAMTCTVSGNQTSSSAATSPARASVSPSSTMPASLPKTPSAQAKETVRTTPLPTSTASIACLSLGGMIMLGLGLLL